MIDGRGQKIGEPRMTVLILLDTSAGAPYGRERTATETSIKQAFFACLPSE
jgi:hypothetical protein